MNIPTCPNCKMRIVPKADGTCPSCGTMIGEENSMPPVRPDESVPSRKEETPSRTEPAAAKLPEPIQRSATKEKASKLEASDDQEDENEKKAKKYFDRAYEYNQNSEYELALKACDKAIELAPDWSDGHNLRGVILEDMGLLEKAISEYRTAVHLEPADMDAKENLALALKESAKQEKRTGNKSVVPHVNLTLQSGEKVLYVTRWIGGCGGIFWVLTYITVNILLAGAAFYTATWAYSMPAGEYKLPLWLLLLVYFGLIMMIWDLIDHVISLAIGRAVLTNRRIVVKHIPRLRLSPEISLDEVKELEKGRHFLIWGYETLLVKSKSGAQKKWMVHDAQDLIGAWHKYRMDRKKEADEDQIEAAIAARRAARTGRPTPSQATPDATQEAAVVRPPAGPGDEAARFCTNCGKPLSTEDKFCAMCGAAVKTRNLPPARSPEIQNKSSASAPLPAKKAGRGGEYGFFEMGKEQQMLGKWSEALHHFQQAIEMDPGRSETYFEAYACLLHLKRYDEALICLDRMVELDPGLAGSVEYHRRNVARQRLVFQDMEAKQVQDIDGMLDLIRHKDDAEVKHSIADLNFDPIILAKVLWSADLAPAALTRLMDALTDENVDVRFSAVATLGVKQHTEAIDLIGWVLNRDPAPVVRSAAAISLGKMDTEKVRSWLRMAEKRDPEEAVQKQIAASVRHLNKLLGLPEDYREPVA